MRGSYNTRQKRDLMSFLERSGMDHYSLDDLVFKLQQSGESMGRSTVYRYLEQLAEQGSVRKYQSVSGITLYQPIYGDSDCDAHFHMMCKKCGTLFHVSCELMHGLEEHLHNEHGFMLDPRESILVGTCAACRGEELSDGADKGGECHHCV